MKLKYKNIVREFEDSHAKRMLAMPENGGWVEFKERKIEDVRDNGNNKNTKRGTKEK